MKINYNFKDLDKAMFNFKLSQGQKELNDIKNELNKFFKDSKCKDIIYTKNTDKPFFGMCIIPVIIGDTAIKILTDNKKIRLNEYYIEIDSKLLDISFTSRELTAMLLHEIGHLVNNSNPTEQIKDAINIYLKDNDETLIITKSVQYRDILAFGIKEGIRNLTSLFKKDDNEIIADQFSVSCGYGKDLENAFKKIVNNTSTLNKGVPKLIALQWTLRLYKNIKLNRIHALHTINKAKTHTASKLQKRELNIIYRRLNQIDDHDLINESTNKLIRKVSDIYKRFKYKGIRTLEDDLYEINLRVKNCDEQDEALSLLRMINVRLSILDDHINSTTKLHENDIKRCTEMINKYRLVRENLSKKTVYDQKFYGLFVKTPVVKSRYDF